MQAKIEIIDPAYAKQLLATGISNRPISEAAVLRYAKDMAEEKWQSNGQGVVLTDAGVLLDGQHRMHAVVRAGCPVSMLVVRGVDQDSFVTIDSGRARMLSDVLAIDGYHNTNQLAASARLAYNYIVGTNLRQSPTKPSLRQFVMDCPYLPEIGKTIYANPGKGPIRRLSTAMAGVLFLGNSRRRYDPEIAEFHDAVVSGQGLFKGDPRLALREWIINHDNKAVSRIDSDMIFSGIAKAWNAFATGDAMQIIRPVVGATRATLPIRGFERAVFRTVQDVPQAPQYVQPRGKNTQDLAHRPVDRPGAR